MTKKTRHEGPEGSRVAAAVAAFVSGYNQTDEMNTTTRLVVFQISSQPKEEEMNNCLVLADTRQQRKKKRNSGSW